MIRQFGWIALAVCFLCASSLLGQESPQDIIRSAAEDDYPPFSQIAEDGQATGFSVELLRAALHAMNRDVAFDVGAWSDIKNSLERGELDVLPLAGRTPERESVFDFTFPYLSLHGAIVVREDTADIDELNDLIDKQVAVMEGDNAEEFLRRENPGIDIHTTSTFDQALHGLSDGLYDAVIIQRLLALRLIQQSGITNLKIVGKPLERFRQDFCFAVAEGDSKLLSVLNEGLSIVMTDGTFDRLQTKWFAALEIPSDRRVVVGTEIDYPPYSFVDGSGHATGFNVDVVQAIADVMDLDIEVRIGPWGEIRQALEQGEIDAIAGMFYSIERDRLVDFSAPYTIIHHAIFGRSNGPDIESEEQLKGKEIIVMRGDIMHDYVLENGLSEDPILVDTPDAALELLASGQHDVALLAKLPGRYWIEKLELFNIERTGPLLLPSEYSFAVSDGNTALLSSLSEGLVALHDTGRLKEITDKWLGVLEPQSVDVRRIALYGTVILAPILILLAASLVWSRTLSHRVESRTREVEARERQYRTLFHSVADAVLIFDNNTHLILDANRTTISRYGYSLDELRSMTPLDLHPQEDAEAVAANLRDPNSSGAHYYTHLTKDGTRLSVEILTEAMEYRGAPAWISVVRDVSTRRRAEVALQESETRFRDLYEEAPLGYQSLDAEGRIITVNKPWLELLGYEKDEVLGKWFGDFLEPDDQEKLSNNFQHFVQAGQIAGIEFSVRTKSGESKQVSIDGKIGHASDGGFKQTHCIVRDVSTLREIEAHLRQQQKLESLGTMASGVAHEINNPLMGMINYAELVRDRLKDDATATEYTTGIIEEGQRIAVIVKNLLSFARRDRAGQSEARLHDIVIATLSLVQSSLRKDQIAIEVDVPEELPKIACRSQQIQQVLINLLTNAQAALNERYPEYDRNKVLMILGSTLRDESGEWLRLTVEDHGAGIPEPIRNRIFDPFFTSKTRDQGTGLGLSVSHGIIAEHKGRLSVESVEGQFTRFYIDLPTNLP